MQFNRVIAAVAGIVIFSVPTVFARSILEKDISYVSTDHKSSEAKFWVVFLGEYDCTLTRNIPGEGSVQVNASVNLQLISSGYIEGTGYGSKGKIDCVAGVKIKNGEGERTIPLDSIKSFYDEGQKVRMTNGDTGDFVIDLEGQDLSPKKFLLREYKLTDYYGEQILKGTAEAEVPLESLSFLKSTHPKASGH